MSRTVAFQAIAITAIVALFSGCQKQDSDTMTKAEIKAQKEMALLQKTATQPSLAAPMSQTALPDFGQIGDVKTKKRAFFDFLQPMIEQENQHLIQLRQHFTKLQQLLKQQGKLHPSDQKWLTQAARLYRANADTPTQQLKLLLAKVDQIPPALVKAQAANESAWGTSRFARQANNLFGQWCFTPGCGIAPLQRGPDQDHEVQAFSSVAAGLRSYFTNLNGNKSYTDLRQIRRCLNSQQQPLSGRALAAGLTHYSARGGHYVEELQAMIRINKLEPWQTLWWGDSDPDHACYPLVQIEADHPDPVVAIAPDDTASASLASDANQASTAQSSVSAVITSHSTLSISFAALSSTSSSPLSSSALPASASALSAVAFSSVLAGPSALQTLAAGAISGPVDLIIEPTAASEPTPSLSTELNNPVR